LAILLRFQKASGPLLQKGRPPGSSIAWTGVTYIDRRMFAVADRERRDWYLVREGQHHTTLRIEPA
jgi:hypothetical protein